MEISGGHTSKMCSVTMREVIHVPEYAKLKELMSKNHGPIIAVRLYFRHWHERHGSYCKDAKSPCPEDHIVLDKQVHDPGHNGALLVVPLDPATLPFRLTMACTDVKALPDYVSPGVWRYVNDKVLDFLLKNVNFDGGHGFHMVGVVDVSTIVDVADDDDDRADDVSDIDAALGKIREFLEELGFMESATLS